MRFFRFVGTEPQDSGTLRLASVGKLSEDWGLLQTPVEGEQYVARARDRKNIDEIMESGGRVALYRPRRQNLSIGDAIDEKKLEGVGYGNLIPVEAFPA